MKKIDNKIKQFEKKQKSHSLIKITKEEIVHNLISLSTSINVISHLVSMAIYALGEHPKMKQKIIDEIKEIIPHNLTYETLQVKNINNFRN